MGIIWGDKYPCLIEPNNQEPSHAYLEEGTTTNDKTLLLQAARNGEYNACQDLIDFGFNPNDQDEWGQTPLYFVAETAQHAKTSAEKKSS